MRVARVRVRRYESIAEVEADLRKQYGASATLEFHPARGRAGHGRHDGSPGTIFVNLPDSAAAPPGRAGDPEDDHRVTSRDGVVTGRAAVRLRRLPRRGMLQYQDVLQRALRALPAA